MRNDYKKKLVKRKPNQIEDVITRITKKNKKVNVLSKATAGRKQVITNSSTKKIDRVFKPTPTL